MNGPNDKLIGINFNINTNPVSISIPMPNELNKIKIDFNVSDIRPMTEQQHQQIVPIFGDTPQVIPNTSAFGENRGFNFEQASTPIITKDGAGQFDATTQQKFGKETQTGFSFGFGQAIKSNTSNTEFRHFSLTITNCGAGLIGPSVQPTFSRESQTRFDFGETQTKTSQFGQASKSNITKTSGGANVFGTTFQSAFGAKKTVEFDFFGAPLTTASTSNTPSSLFVQPNTSQFGANKTTGFGFGGAQPSTSLFGQASTSNIPNTGFGSFGTTTTSGEASIFGATAQLEFGQPGQPESNGSAMTKYQPSLGSDSVVIQNQTKHISVKQNCITAMKEYEAKSLEEIRMEDYIENRTGIQSDN